VAAFALAVPAIFMSIIMLNALKSFQKKKKTLLTEQETQESIHDSVVNAYY
jgi:hypothetical protein